MSLTIDGKTLNKLGLALLPGHEHPAAPSTRDYTVGIPGMPGAYDFGADLEPRPFTLPLLVKPQANEYLLAKKIRGIMQTFFDSYGKPKTVKLIYDYEPDKYYKVRYSGSLDTTRYKTMANLVFPLTAFDPHAYSVTESTDDIFWRTDIPFTSDIPFGIQPSQYTITSPQTVNIDNLGFLVVRPVIEITGNATDLTLTMNREGFSFGSFTNASFLIDGKTYTAIKNGQNFLSELKGNLEKIELIPGKNAVKIGGTNLNINIAIKFHAKYM
ncbi:phage tail family protein [Bacillus tropicus]|uniref:phage tail domain-containing protein n=1 Tax=Bacillus tropicus TaxID=2026188 RepID=UPI001E3E18A3|nr:phage tail domain-containing protein [Bacillus tropicus]MCC1486754.1 phage tail family protein [Bacillus tropicus]